MAWRRFMNRGCSESRSILPWLLASILLLLTDPALANKFETIGNGVQGSTQLKVAYLQVIAYVAGAIFLAAGVLSILLQNKNALTLNYTMWRSSSILFFLLSITAFATGFYLT
jgi:hypothetical protein